MIEQADRRPMYRRLRDQIAIEIAQNRWAPGAAIASNRSWPRPTTFRSVRFAKQSTVWSVTVWWSAFTAAVPLRRPDFGHSIIRFTQVYGSAGNTRAPDGQILKRETMVGPQAVTEALQLEHVRRSFGCYGFAFTTAFRSCTKRYGSMLHSSLQF